MGSIKIGRCIWNPRGGYTVPRRKEFTNVIVLTKSSEYGSLGPYLLKDNDGRIIENVWQGSKVYPSVPKISCPYTQRYKKIVWEWPLETHVDVSLNPTEKYWIWRRALMENSEAVRYPVGRENSGTCLYALHPSIDKTNFDPSQKLDYIEARKKIYLPYYVEAAKKTRQFKELKDRLDSGENLMILEVDGPWYSLNFYYEKKYGIENLIDADNSIDCTEENLKILLNDPAKPFGHGYCLGAALLGIEENI